MSDVQPPAGLAAAPWQVLTATVRGSTHELTGLPLQDAAGYAGDPAQGGVLAVAVADGHGNERHFRSAQGSALAVQAAEIVAEQVGPLFAAAATTADARAIARQQLVPGVVDWWRRAVARDLAQRPLTDSERHLVRAGDDLTVPYGSTLLLAVSAFPVLVLGQIGDGDIVMADSGGHVTVPVPGDPRLDGQHTTSLCQPDAGSAFRLAAVDLNQERVAALLLATDGFGNAQTAEAWQQPVGADLVRFTRQHGLAWMREQLPLWASRCASAEGSGDDTAVALLLRTDRPSVMPASVPFPATLLSRHSTETWPP